MAYKPILFNTQMVQAIVEGRKTQTRRIIKDNSVCQPFEPGDIMWVRETWARPSEAEVRNGAPQDMFIYKADSPLLPAAHDHWHPSIHMPKEAARIFLRVKDVRVERLKAITDRDAECEGVSCFYPGTNIVVPETMNFIKVWDSTIKPADRDKYSWKANPWVWVIEFERCEKPEGWPDV